MMIRRTREMTRRNSVLRYSFLVIGCREENKNGQVKSPAEGPLPAAHLAAELAVAPGGRGDAKLLGHRRCWAREA